MSKELCIFGEVLFDRFPDGHHVLGGAPFNVAWHLQAFGQSPYFISRIGKDPEGIRVRKTMLDWGMDTDALQTDNNYPTGKVNIELVNGEPHYDIVEPCAYDNIHPVTLGASDCQILYHGSLALRSIQSEKALLALLKNNPSLLFVDVNLRSPWWNTEAVLQMLKHADWVKLNEEELGLLYPSDEDTATRQQAIIDLYDLKGLILTHGGKGAELLTAQGERHSVSPRKETKVADTVGAGDAFSSVVILGLKNGWPLSLTAQRAQEFASAIVQKRGAIVKERKFYLDLMKNWGLG